MRFARVLLLGGLVCGAAAAAPPPPPKWKVEVPWRPSWTDAERLANVKAIRGYVRGMVKVDPDPKKATFAYAVPGLDAGKVEGVALQALAAMSALPFLTRGNPEAEQNLFDCAREAARKGMAGVLRVALPEYWRTVKEKPEPAGAPESALEVYARLDTRRAYSCPLLLMALEMYFSGALEIDFDGGREDRPGRGVPRLEAPAQLGVARLVALLLASKPEGGQFDPDLKPDSLWEYSTFGISPETTCLHKSGFVWMGLRPAASLGACSFPEEAYAFEWQKGGGKLGRKRFIDRYSDAVVHSLRTIMEIKSGGAAEKSIGVLGFADYLRLQPDRKAVLDSVPDDSVNVLDYRTIHAVDRKGRRIFAVERDLAPAAWPAGVPREAAFRYLPHGLAYGTYHTSQAAYIALSAANTLPMLLAARGGPLGRQYKIKPDPARPGAWTLDLAGTTLGLHLDGPPGRFTNLRVTRLDDPGTLHWDIDRRVAQCINFLVRVASRPDSHREGARSLDRTPVTFNKAQLQRWETTLGVYAARNGMWLSLCLYGYVKLAIAAGCPDAFGPWPVGRDINAILCDTTFSGPPDAAQVHREFALLVLTRGYRPLYGRDSAK
jgi:hypothetical protein